MSLDSPPPISRPGRVVAVFLAVLGSLPVLRYLAEGTALYHINSVGSSTLLFLKIPYDRFRDLDFLPVMWTNLYGSGGPLAVGPATFNPVLLTVSWLSPFNHALIAYEVVMRVLGALGCYAFLRRNQVAVPAALAGGGIWALNAFAMTAGQDPQIGQSTLLLPWILLAAQYAVEQPSWRAASALSLSMAVLYLVGTTQVLMTAVLGLAAPFVAGIAVVRLFQPAAPSPLLGRVLWPAVCLVAAAAGLMAVVSFDLVQQLDNLALGSQGLRVSTIFQDYLDLGVRMFIVSLALHLFVASRWMITRAIGLGAVLYGYWLMLVTLRIDPATLLSANTGATPFSEFIFDLQIPKYLYTSIPVCLAGVAAWAMLRQPRRNAGAILLVCLGGAYGLMPMVLGRVPDYYITRVIFVPLLGYSVFAAIGGSWLLDRFAGAPVVRYRVAALALVVVAMGEAINVTARQVLYTPGIKYTRLSSPEMTYLSTLGPMARVIDEYEGENTLEWAKQVPYHRAALPRWLIPAYSGAQTFSRIGVSLVQNDYQDFYERALYGTYFGSKIGEWSPLLDLAAVTHLIAHDPPAADFIPRLEGPDYTVYENPRALPRVQVYDRAIALDNKAGLQHLEATAARGASFAAVVAPDQAGLVGRLDEGKGGVADIVLSSGDRIVIEVAADGRSLVSLAETYYPGWQAWVDGQPVPVIRTNVAFKGVIAEPGRHTIEFRYRPRLRTPLLWLAAIAAVIQLALLARHTAPRRN